MVISEIRNKQLSILIEDYMQKNPKGTLTHLSKTMGLSFKYFSNIINGRAPIGNKTARKIEKSLGIRKGFLDENTFGVSDDLVQKNKQFIEWCIHWSTTTDPEVFELQRFLINLTRAEDPALLQILVKHVERSLGGQV